MEPHGAAWSRMEPHNGFRGNELRPVVRFRAAWCRSLLRRFLRRECVGFCVASWNTPGGVVVVSVQRSQGDRRFGARLPSGWVRNGRRLSKVGVRDLVGVLLGDVLAVAKPRTDDVRRKDLRQLSLTRTTKVVKDSGPCRQARILHDPPQANVQVAVPPAEGPHGSLAKRSADYVTGADRSSLKTLPQLCVQFWE